MHQTEENPSHHKAEPRKSNHGNRLVELSPAPVLILRPLSRMRLVSRDLRSLHAKASATNGFNGASHSGTNTQIDTAKHWLQRLRDIFQVYVGVLQTRGCTVRKILHQQEIDLVPIGVAMFLLGQMMDQKHA